MFLHTIQNGIKISIDIKIIIGFNEAVIIDEETQIPVKVPDKTDITFSHNPKEALRFDESYEVIKEKIELLEYKNLYENISNFPIS